MSDKPITLAGLMTMLRRLEEDRKGKEMALGLGLDSSSALSSLANGSLKSMLDRFDITERVSGKFGGYTKSESGLLVPPMDTVQAFFTSPWGYTYRSVATQSFTVAGITAYEQTEEDKQSRLKAEQEKERQLLQLESLIDSISSAPSVKLANPNLAPTQAQRSPDYMETLTGWRGWAVDHEMLKSVGTFNYWRPHVATHATCYYEGHESPHFICSCGYWSFKSSDLMKKAVCEYRDSIAVVGSVELWGRVIECENGYRSEYAYPKELWLLKPGLEYLSWTYGVPVRTIPINL